MFAEFGDTRLPEEFRGLAGRGDRHADARRGGGEWDQLSPATREALDPFFIPPFNPGSWYEPASAAGLRALAGPRAARPRESASQGPTCATNTAPNMNRWGYVTAVGGKVRVWYENTRAGQLEKAISVAEYLDSGVWGKVISVFRQPLMDGGDLTGQRCRGFDPAIDFVLSAFSGADGRTIAYYDNGGCEGPAAGFVLVKRELTGKELMSTVAHELAHLGQDAFSEDHCRPWISWLAEATAAWVENYVGGLGPDHPEQFAPYFFDRPKLSLETNEEDRDPAPVRLLSLLPVAGQAQELGGGHQDLGAQRAMAAIRSTPSRRRSRSSGYAGGFEEAWKQFALAGLNPRQDVDWFKQWGMARGAEIDRDRVFADNDGKTFAVALPHLSAEYHWLDFTEP